MKKNAVVSFKGQKDIHATINLTGSKSESNRALVIAAISKDVVKVTFERENLLGYGLIGHEDLLP